MRWFEGSIPDAIQETKTSRKLLLVYVLDSTEDSRSMTAVLDEDAVTEALPAEKVVALKLESGTDSFAQFSVFYPVLILPSVYFIGENGTPLEVVGGHQAAEAFLEKTRNAFKLHEEGIPAVSAPATETASTSETPVVVAAPAAGSVDAAPSTPSATTATEDHGAAAASASSTAPPPTDSLEDRVVSAKDKIEAQNRERINKEQEESKRRELERRKLGQEMAEAQRLKEEAAMKQRAEALAKEKADEKLARQKIKEQIEKDRKERHAKFEEEKRAKDQKIREKVEEKQAAEAAAAAALQERIRSVSRIQFRLPDGGAITHEFPVDTSFADLRLFIADELQSRGMTDFDLVHSFSRRQFQSADLTSKLTELDLAGPNALIVVPRRGDSGRSAANQEDGFSLVSLFWLVMAPFVFIFNILRAMFVGGPQPQSVTATSSSTEANPTSSLNVGGPVDRSQDVRQRPSAQGNIHRLRHDSDSDSDDPTWNGNSTQQL